MDIKRIMIPLLLILFMVSMVAFGAPVYVNVGPTTEFDGDIKILSEIVAEGTTADGWETTVFFTDPTADRTITIPDYDVTVGSAILLTVTDNEATNENNAILFTSGGVESGVLNIESDGGDFYYNPSDGSLHTTMLYGDGSNITAVGAAAASALTISAKAAEDITKGEVVYISGAVGQTPQVSLADNTVAGKACPIGVAAETKTTGQTILIRVAGQLIGVNTSAFVDGDCLFLSTAGSLINSTPTSGVILHVADVEYDAVAGKLLVSISRKPQKGATSGTDLYTRLGDNIGVNKIEYRDYANNVVAYIDSDGKADFTSLTLDTALADAEIASAATWNAKAASGANTDITSILNTALYVGRDLDNRISWATDDRLIIEIANVIHTFLDIETGAGNNDSLVTQGYVDDAAAGGGANLALSNLVGVAINTSLVSDAADTDDLGSVTKEWLNLYLGTYGTVYFGTGQTENIAETAVNELTITSTTVAISGTLAMGANNITTTGYIGRDADNYLSWDTDNTLKIEINNILHSIVSITNGVANNDKLATQGYVDDQVAGANVNLSNLAAVAINTTLISDAADTDSLGDATHEWLNLYIGDAGKILLGLGQTVEVYRSAANTLTITASTGVLLTGPLGVTGTRVSKGWFTDLEVTNTIAGSITGNARGLVSIANGDITIQPNGTGDTIIYAPADVVTSVNAVHTMTIAEAGTVKVSAAGAAYTITLPTASGHTGLRYHFIKTDANYTLITLDGNGAETFNYENSTSAPTLTYIRLNTYCAEVTIVSDGTNWQVVNEAMGQVPDCSIYIANDQLDVTDNVDIMFLYDTENYDIGSNYDISTWESGNATSTSAGHLVDTNATFVATMVGVRVKNTTDATETYITAVNSATDVTVRNDIFVDTEAYEIKNSKFVAPVSGRYLIVSNAIWKAASVVADKWYNLYIKNNGSKIAIDTRQSSVNNTFTSTVNMMADLSKDDEVNTWVKSVSGVDTTDLYGLSYAFIQIRLISKD